MYPFEKKWLKSAKKIILPPPPNPKIIPTALITNRLCKLMLLFFYLVAQYAWITWVWRTAESPSAVSQLPRPTATTTTTARHKLVWTRRICPAPATRGVPAPPTPISGSRYHTRPTDRTKAYDTLFGLSQTTCWTRQNLKMSVGVKQTVFQKTFISQGYTYKYILKLQNAVKC